MKMTNARMCNYIDLMNQLHETGKLGYAIAKNKRMMETEAKEYLDLRAQLFNKYGQVLDDGHTMTIKKEYLEEYSKEIGDIPREESDIKVYKIDEQTFCSGSLTSNQMSQLLWMVDDRED